MRPPLAQEIGHDFGKHKIWEMANGKHEFYTFAK